MTTVPIGVAEETEIAAYVDFATGAPADVRDQLGIASLHTGSVRALTIREDPSRFYNRAGGFGVAEPVTADVVARICDFYAEQGVSVGSMMIAPSLLPPDWPAVAAKLNLTEGTRFAKLGCDLTALSTVDRAGALDPGLRVQRVQPHQAHEWATVLTTTFGHDAPGMAEMAASCVGRPGWQQYAVLDGDRIVSVSGLYVHGECADMFGGATLPEARGRGAQSALLAARLRAAQAAGCRWMVAETGAEGPGQHNTSLHNMLRAGLEPLYERVSWRWHSDR